MGTILAGVCGFIRDGLNQSVIGLFFNIPSSLWQRRAPRRTLRGGSAGLDDWRFPSRNRSEGDPIGGARPERLQDERTDDAEQGQEPLRGELAGGRLAIPQGLAVCTSGSFSSRLARSRLGRPGALCKQAVAGWHRSPAVAAGPARSPRPVPAAGSTSPAVDDDAPRTRSAPPPLAAARNTGNVLACSEVGMVPFVGRPWLRRARAQSTHGLAFDLADGVAVEDRSARRARLRDRSDRLRLRSAGRPVAIHSEAKDREFECGGGSFVWLRLVGAAVNLELPKRWGAPLVRPVRRSDTQGPRLVGVLAEVAVGARAPAAIGHAAGLRRRGHVGREAVVWLGQAARYRPDPVRRTSGSPMSPVAVRMTSMASMRVIGLPVTLTVSMAPWCCCRQRPRRTTQTRVIRRRASREVGPGLGQRNGGADIGEAKAVLVVDVVATGAADARVPPLVCHSVLVGRSWSRTRPGSCARRASGLGFPLDQRHHPATVG